MSGTARTPIARRAAQPQVSPRAIELFAAMEKARRARRRAGCNVGDLSGYCRGTCSVCRQWLDLHDHLHRELRLKPWQWPCVPRNPYPPGSAAAQTWRADGEQQALWDLLHDAAVEAAHAIAPVN